MAQMCYGGAGEGPTGEGPTGEGPTGEGPTGEGPTGEGPRLGVSAGAGAGMTSAVLGAKTKSRNAKLILGT